MSTKLVVYNAIPRIPLPHARASRIAEADLSDSLANRHPTQKTNQPRIRRIKPSDFKQNSNQSTCE